MQPLVSIITPCYNGEHCIERMMDSVLAQTYDNIEFIIINDGSTDNSAVIIQQYEKAFIERGYKFIYHYQENAGLGAAINAGLKLFNGEYLCWPDADDYLEKDSVKERVDAFKTHSDCAVVTSNAYVRECGNLTCYKGLIADNLKRSGEEKQFELLLNGDNIFCSGCHMVRVKEFLEVNPKREIYPARRGQNWQMLLPLYFKYKRFFLDKPLYNYIIYPNSMSKDNNTAKSKLTRYNEHEHLLKHTLKMIEEVQDVDLHQYYSFLEDKYAKLRMEIAIQYGNKGLFHNEYVKKQQMVGLDRRDRTMYLRNQYPAINKWLKLLRKAGRPEDVAKKLKNFGSRVNCSNIATVTIIIPCYNGANYLHTCLKSVLEQSYKKIEVIIVNDGSEDNSEEIIFSYRESFERRGYNLKYISQDNQGAAAAINNALPYVTGDYLMLYDVDDVIFRDNVLEKVSFLEQNSEYSMVCNNGYYVKSIEEVGTRLFWNSKSYERKDMFEELLVGKALNWPGSYMVRTNEFIERILPDRQIYISQFGQNLQVMLPMAYRSKVGFISKPLMKYYIHSDSHSHVGGKVEILQRSRGYEGNRLGVLETMHIEKQELNEYILRVRKLFAERRILQTIKWQDEKLFCEELNACTEGKYIYIVKWWLSRIGIFTWMTFLHYTFIRLVNVWKNTYYGLKIMNENEKGY